MVASLLALALLLGALLPASPLTLRTESAASRDMAPMPAVPSVPARPLNVPAMRPPLSPLAVRLQIERTAIVRDVGGQVVSIFGLPANEARVLLLPVNRQRGLPEGSVPAHLVVLVGRQVQGTI